MSKIAEQLGIHIDLYFTFIAWGLIFIRIFIMLLLNPFMGSKGVPGRVRMTTALVLATFMYPLIVDPVHDRLPDDKGILLALFFKEVFFGMTVGMMTTFVFHAIEAAGKIVDQQRGGANAELFVPQLGQVSLFGSFNYWLAIAVFLSVGGHRVFLQAFLGSFETVPLLVLPHFETAGFAPFLQLMTRLSGDVLIIAVQLAAPVMIVSILIDVILGITNKMAPQVNVFELGFAIRGYAAPLVMWVGLLIMVSQMKVILAAMIKSVNQLATVFGGS